MHICMVACILKLLIEALRAYCERLPHSYHTSPTRVPRVDTFVRTQGTAVNIRNLLQRQHIVWLVRCHS